MSGKINKLPAKKGTFLYNIKRYAILYLMLLPAVIGFIIFQYIPSIGGFLVALTNYNLVDGFFKSPFVGLKWFIQFVNDPFFIRLMRKGNSAHSHMFALVIR